MRRKSIAIFVAALLASVLLIGCSQGLSNKTDDMGSENNISHVVSVSVNCDYGNITKGKATLVLSNDVNIKKNKMKSKSNRQIINNIVVGDELEVTYKEQTNDTVSQVLVDTADYMVVNIEKEFLPGSNKLDFFIHVKPGENNTMPTVIRHYHLDYIIDEHGCLIDKADGYKFDKLYGVYKKADIEETVLDRIITLSAIYTCDPRIVSLDYVIDN